MAAGFAGCNDKKDTVEVKDTTIQQVVSDNPPTPPPPPPPAYTENSYAGKSHDLDTVAIKNK